MSAYYATLLSSAGKAEVTPVVSATPTFARPDSEVASSTVTIEVSDSELSGGGETENDLAIRYGVQK